VISIKTKEEITILREGGKRLAKVLQEVVGRAAPGVSAQELNNLVEQLIKEGGDIPAFLNYKPNGASEPYPASLCVSINNEIVHGIPGNEGKILKEGDVASFDLGLIHKGLVTDTAYTIGIGSISEENRVLIKVTKDALFKGIDIARVGNTIGDIGAAIEEYIEPYGFAIFEELVGHGVGYSVHEEPYIPNYGNRGTGEKLMEGMVLAIEPMIGNGKSAIKLLSDGYTYVTKDGSTSAHFEHTIVITNEDPEILTPFH